MRAAVLDDDGAPAVGYAISRRGRTAVERNRIRRRVQAAIQLHADELQSGHAYLFGARAGVETATWKQLESWTVQLLRRQ